MGENSNISIFSGIIIHILITQIVSFLDQEPISYIATHFVVLLVSNWIRMTFAGIVLRLNASVLDLPAPEG